MTGPNPDAELDAALGLDHLPPPVPTEAQLAEGRRLVELWRGMPEDYDDQVLGQWIGELVAVAEQRGAARVLATHAAAGAPLPPPAAATGCGCAPGEYESCPRCQGTATR